MNAVNGTIEQYNAAFRQSARIPSNKPVNEPLVVDTAVNAVNVFRIDISLKNP